MNTIDHLLDRFNKQNHEHEVPPQFIENKFLTTAEIKIHKPFSNRDMETELFYCLNSPRDQNLKARGYKVGVSLTYAPLTDTSELFVLEDLPAEDFTRQETSLVFGPPFKKPNYIRHTHFVGGVEYNPNETQALQTYQAVLKRIQDNFF